MPSKQSSGSSRRSQGWERREYLFSAMTTQTVNQIEEQFARLSPEDQLSLLDRLAHQRRPGVSGSNGATGRFSGALAVRREIQPEVDRKESRADESDLLSEAW